MPAIYPDRLSSHSLWAFEHIPGLVDIDALEDGALIEQRTNGYEGRPGENAQRSRQIIEIFARRIGWRYETRRVFAGTLRTSYLIFLRSFRERNEPAFVYVAVGNGRPTSETGGRFEPIDHVDVVLDDRFHEFRKACAEASVPVVIAKVDRDGRPLDDQLAEDIVGLNIFALRRRAQVDAIRFDDKRGAEIYRRLLLPEVELDLYDWTMPTSEYAKVAAWAYPKGRVRLAGGWQKVWPLRSIRNAQNVKTRAVLPFGDDGGTIAPNRSSFALEGTTTISLYTVEAEVLLAFDDTRPSPFRELTRLARAGVKVVRECYL